MWTVVMDESGRRLMHTDVTEQQFAFDGNVHLGLYLKDFNLCVLVQP